MLIQPLLLTTELPIEGVAPVVVALGGACAALWRRAQVLQDRQTLRDEAHLKQYVKMAVMMTEALHKNSEALEANTSAIKEALNAG